MAVSNIITEQTFSCNGVTTSFAIPCAFFSNSQIYVQKILVADKTYTTLTSGVDYNITGGDPGTAVVTTSAYAATFQVRIVRAMPKTQVFDFLNSTTVNLESIESMGDRIVLEVQDNYREILKSVRLPESIQPASFSPVLPTVLTADASIVINSGGNGLALGPSVTTIASDVAAAAASASAASGSASAASASASAASGSASAASTSASAASSSASAASGSAAAALASEVAAAASVANTALRDLSNLTTTSVNQTLTSDTDLGRSLGTSAKKWNTAHVGYIKYNNFQIDMTAGQLYDSTPVVTLDWFLLVMGSLTKKWDTFHSFVNLVGSTSGSVILQASGTTTNHTLTLPSAQGSANTILSNNGSGALSWVSPPGAAIGASVTSATQGSVFFAGASGVLAQDNANLFWDDANNRLGIGTATPSYQLHQSSASRARYVIQGASATTGTQGADISIFDGTVAHTVGFMQSIFGTGGRDLAVSAGGTTENISFTTNSTERMRIGSTGLVGIGSTAASAGLEVSKTVLSGGVNYSARFSDNVTSTLKIGHAAGYSQIFCDTPIDFNVQSATTLKLNSNGLGIGIATSYQLQLSSDSAGKPSTNTWTVVSDRRIKENIVNANLDRCLEIVNEINLKRYRWSENAYTSEEVGDRAALGFIAQDVQKVFPKAVSIKPFTMKDGTIIEDCLDLQVDQLYKVMWGAMQKLSQKIDQLEIQNASLQSRIEILEQISV